MRHAHVRRVAVVAATLMLALVLAACGNSVEVQSPNYAAGASPGPDGEIGNIKVSDAWARPAEKGGSTAVYMVIANDGTEDDALTDVAAPDVTDEAMLHESKMVDNVMIMEHVHQIDVPAGGQATLERGGLHVMLIDVSEELKVGDSVTLTLYFRDAGMLTLQVPVEER